MKLVRMTRRESLSRSFLSAHRHTSFQMWKVSFIWEWLFIPEEGKDTHRRLDVDAKLDPRADVDVPVELEQTVEFLLTRRADCPVLGVDHQEIIVSRVVFNTIPPIE